MQKLKNIATGAEYIITGLIGVPRETKEENVFEVWTHFSVDLGEGRVDTIEVHPESTEWEVIDAPDPEPVVEEPIVEPEPTPEPTEEELALAEAQEARNEWFKRKSALAQMIDDMEKGKELGMEPTAEQMAIMTGLAQWVNANLKQEYYF